MSLLAELKRRNVLRAAALQIGAAWALAQGVAQILPVFDTPNWVARWFLVAAGIGFPFAMLFSWFYEWTPHGIVRESENPRGREERLRFSSSRLSSAYRPTKFSPAYPHHAPSYRPPCTERPAQMRACSMVRRSHEIARARACPCSNAV